MEFPQYTDKENLTHPEHVRQRRGNKFTKFNECNLMTLFHMYILYEIGLVYWLINYRPINSYFIAKLQTIAFYKNYHLLVSPPSFSMFTALVGGIVPILGMLVYFWENCYL